MMCVCVFLYVFVLLLEVFVNLYLITCIPQLHRFTRRLQESDVNTVEVQSF